MKKETSISSKLLNSLWVLESHSKHLQRLKHVKSTMDYNSLHSKEYPHLKQQRKKNLGKKGTSKLYYRKIRRN